MWRIPALFVVEVAALVGVYYAPHWYCGVGCVGAMVGAAMIMVRDL